MSIQAATFLLVGQKHQSRDRACPTLTERCTTPPARPFQRTGDCPPASHGLVMVRLSRPQNSPTMNLAKYSRSFASGRSQTGSNLRNHSACPLAVTLRLAAKVLCRGFGLRLTACHPVATPEHPKHERARD